MKQEHPVWEVYDLLRTAKLNEKYFGYRLKKYVCINFFMEFTIAATASTSAVASLTLWNDGLGGYFWKIFLVLSAVISVAKPILGITKRVRLYEEVLSEYRSLSYELLQLKISISTARKYDGYHKGKLQEAMEKHAALISKSPESTESKGVKAKCVDEVLKAYPPNVFFIPKGL
ncbi:hypothetical protein [Aeromonas piscicola]|uniref:hypothetical protein n=1 Tax=Aeromonas piscicola TaxID=600645 RepID=UPI0021F914F8|nr:hypothetical protein [Aeromonas piscicola]MCW0506940.1 hypothetical protein [Aeromonas piscicola]